MDARQESELVTRVKDFVFGLNNYTQMEDDQLKEVIRERIELASLACSFYIAIADKISVEEQVFSSIRGLGLLDSIIKDDTITEVMINGPDNIFIEKNGRLTKLDKVFESTQRLEDVIQRVVGKAGREVNQSNPIVDTRLPDGSRVNVVLPPIALCGDNAAMIGSQAYYEYTEAGITADGSLNAAATLPL